MYKAIEIATRFLDLDKTNKIFKEDDQSNIRLNHYLHIAQTYFYAKYEKLLFEDDSYALEEGPIIPDVTENYNKIFKEENKYIPLDKKADNFVKRVSISLRDASNKEIEAIVKDDFAWKNVFYNKKIPDKMDIKNELENYKTFYEDGLKQLDNIPV